MGEFENCREWHEGNAEADRIKRINDDGYFTQDQIHAMAKEGWEILYRQLGEDVCDITLKTWRGKNAAQS